VTLKFDAYQSYFIIFDKNIRVKLVPGKNYMAEETISTLDGPWKVSFDPKWGGPANITFDKLQDWTTRSEEGIKFYSGTAVYKKEFEMPNNISPGKNGKIYLNLGEVHDMARVKLNGKYLGVIWTAPWRVDISKAIVKGQNKLEIEVVNRWPNRLIGDSKYPDNGVVDEQWPEWLLKGKPRNSKRLTFASHNFYDEKSPLLKSGLVGPVTIQYSEQ
ncbi:MAG: glycosylhydrolase-like jelly roll fold domain-containing protein, partial [Mucilaginibacter sp.]